MSAPGASVTHMPRAAGDTDPGQRISGAALHDLGRITDPRGSITIGEFERTVPFATRRYFVIFGVPEAAARGAHAHRACHQFLVCVHGSCAVIADDGRTRAQFLLDRPDLGLHLPPMIWGEQLAFSADAVLLVFASDYYDDADYIRDHDEFLTLAGVAR